MVLTRPEEITANWIARALHEAGLIAPGDVAGIACQAGDARSWSRITQVQVHYGEGAPADAPQSLLLKFCCDDKESFGRSEVDYYTRDYLGAPDAPLARCFAAAYAESPRRYHLLLEDLSDSHVNGDALQPPDQPFALALAESLAALHAHHWERAVRPGAAEIERFVGHIRPGLEPLLERVDAGLAPQLRGLIGGLADQMIERSRDPRGMTLLHGDLNPGNLLIPRSRQGPVLLLDRQPFDWSLTVWLAASDLVNAIVPWWDTDARRRLEMPTLTHYHAELCRRGVRGYSFEQLLVDYRLSLALAVAGPVEWCVLESDRERMRGLWEMQLRRALAACADFSPSCPAENPAWR